MIRDERDPIVVVGAGVIGLALAWELTRRGRRVRVLERRTGAGRGSSGAAAGMLAPFSEVEHDDPRWTAYARSSRSLYRRFVEELESAAGVTCGYREDGTLWVAACRDDRAPLRKLRDALHRRGLPHRRLDPGACGELEPLLSGRVLEGVLLEDEAQVDPRRLCEALSRGIGRGGGTVETGVDVTSVVARDGRVTGLTVRTDGGGGPETLAASCVAVCAGAWSGYDVRLPLAPLGVRPVKGELLRLRGESPLLRHVVRTPSVYLVPRGDGQLLVGATMEEQGFDLRPTGGAVRTLLREAWRVLPAVDELEFAGVDVGLRPAVDDRMPAIGPSEIRGLYLAVGHHRAGIVAAPATARHLAEAMIDGVVPSEIRIFDPRRIGGPIELERS